MEKIVVIGSSGHAKVIIDIIEKEGRYSIAGLIDNFREIGRETLGYRVLAKDDDLSEIVPELAIYGAVIAIGDNLIRAGIARNIQRRCPGLRFVSAIHPSAAIARDVSIGQGTVLMAGASINPSCSIGDFCIINTNSSLDHDSVMADFASLAPGATTGGNCLIGRAAAIGIGANLVQGIGVGANSIIGAGATVLDNIGPNCLAYGTPAKVIRKIESR